ncbi:HAD family hydrolase [uncultured Bifidobacterium sp.]|uniref:HAD family hydrolase n=1 Tax=uncultured Bifidobacterium sp. TaxID=165187 RepID=UPI0025914568|nr:HAD family hydrolase [uncultured Bifidobacterium sp.]
MTTALKYQAVFFDLYGTLVDIHTDEQAEGPWTALRCALYREGAEFATNKQLRAQFVRERARANAMRDQREWFEPDLLPAYRGLLDACWIDATPEQARAAAWTFRRASTTKLRLFSGATELLDQLHDEGRTVILVSNAQACYTRPELALLGLDEMFDDIIISSDEGVRKPSFEIFRRALMRAGVEPERALMVGNDENSDIFGAVACGIDAAYLHTDDNTGGATVPQAAISLEGADYDGLLAFIHGADETWAASHAQDAATAPSVGTDDGGQVKD